MPKGIPGSGSATKQTRNRKKGKYLSALAPYRHDAIVSAYLGVRHKLFADGKSVDGMTKMIEDRVKEIKKDPTAVI